MPPDIILYALIAAGLIFWLKTIIGTRDEDEEIPTKKTAEEKDPFISLSEKLKKPEDSNVIPLSHKIGQGFDLPANVRIDSKTVENDLERLSKKHENFDFNHFIGGVGYAFPMVIEAFAKGNKETLKSILAEPVYAAFDGAIEARIKRGESVETEVKAIEKIDVLEAVERNKMIFITVRFVARETCVIRDAQEKIISGEPDRTTQMIDVWVFGKDLSSDTPEWYLYETRDGEEEDHKTPMPDAGDMQKE